MARYKTKNLLTGVSGRIENMVTYNLNGVQVVRSLPYWDKKKHKFSEYQEDHHFSFSAQHRFAKSIKKEIIDRIWIHVPVEGGMNAYNLFIRTNKAAFGQTCDIIFPELLTISTGDLCPAGGFLVVKEDNKLIFSWSCHNAGPHAYMDDHLNIAVLLSRNAIRMVETVAVRGDKTTSIIIPNDIRYNEGYVFWSSGDDMRFSPSVYWKVI